MTEIDTTKDAEYNPERLAPKIRMKDSKMVLEVFYLHKKVYEAPIEIKLTEEQLEDIIKEDAIIRIKEAIEKYKIEPHTLCEKWGFA